MTRFAPSCSAVAMTPAMVGLLALVVSGCQAPSMREVAKLDHASMVVSVAYSPDGKLLAPSTKHRETSDTYWAGCIKVWNADTFAELQRIDTDQWANQVAFSPDGKHMAVAIGIYNDTHVPNFNGFSPREGLIRIYDTKEFKQQAVVKHMGGCSTIAYSADGRLLAGGFVRDLSTPGEVVVWDADSLKEKCVVRDFEPIISDIAFSPNGKTLAIAHDRLAFIDSNDGKKIKLIDDKEKRDSGTRCVAFSPDGALLMSTNGKFYLWDMKTYTVKEDLGALGHLQKAAFSPDGKVLAMCGRLHGGGSNGPLCFWDIAARKTIVYFEQSEPATCLAFSPDGKRIAVGGSRGNPGGPVRVYEVPTNAAE